MGTDENDFEALLARERAIARQQRLQAETRVRVLQSTEPPRPLHVGIAARVIDVRDALVTQAWPNPGLQTFWWFHDPVDPRASRRTQRRQRRRLPDKPKIETAAAVIPLEKRTFKAPAYDGGHIDGGDSWGPITIFNRYTALVISRPLPPFVIRQAVGVNSEPSDAWSLEDRLTDVDVSVEFDRALIGFQKSETFADALGALIFGADRTISPRAPDVLGLHLLRSTGRVSDLDRAVARWCAHNDVDLRL